MAFSILSQVPYGAQVPFGDILSSKAAAVNFALTAGFVALQPAFQDLVHTFLDTEVRAASTLAHSAGLAVMGAASVMFSNKSGSSFTDNPPTPTIQSFESSTGHGPLIGVIACATFSVVGAAIAISGRTRSSAGSSAPSGREGEDIPNGEFPNSSAGDSGEDPGLPGDSFNDDTQSEATDSNDARANNVGGSGPPPPPPPPSFNVTDAGDAGDWLALIGINLLGLLLVGHAFASKASPVPFKVKAAIASDNEKVMAGLNPTNSTITISLDDLFQHPTFLSRDALAPALVKVKMLVEPELANTSKHLVCANEMHIPLPCLDVVKPVLSTTCPNTIPFPAPVISLAGADPSLLLENAQSTLIFTDVPQDVSHWKTIILEFLFALIFILGSAVSYVSAVYSEDQVFLKKAQIIEVSTSIVQQPDSEVPDILQYCIIEESTSNGLILQDEDGLVELEETIDIGREKVGTKDCDETEQYEEMLGFLSTLDEGTVTPEDEVDVVKESLEVEASAARNADIIPIQRPEVPGIAEDCNTFEEFAGCDPVLEQEDTLVEQEQTIDVGDEIKDWDDVEQDEEILVFLSSIDRVDDARIAVVFVGLEEEGVEVKIEDIELGIEADAAGVEVEVAPEFEEITVELPSVEDVNLKENFGSEGIESFTEDAKVEGYEVEVLAEVVGLAVGTQSSAFEDIEVNSSEGVAEVDLANTLTAGYHVVSVVEDAGTVEDVDGEEILSEMGQVLWETNVEVASSEDGILVVTAQVAEVQIDEIFSMNDILLQDNVEGVVTAESKDEILSGIEHLFQELGEMSQETSQEFGGISREMGEISQQDSDGHGEESAITKRDKGKGREIAEEVNGQPVTVISSVVTETLKERTSFSTDARAVIQASSTQEGLNPQAPILDPNFRPRVLRTQDVRSLFQRIVQCDTDQPPRPIAAYTTSSYRKPARRIRRRY